MTLEEAIKHAEEVADEKKEEACNLYDAKNYEESRECIWCAEEHRQLAEWLKDYKRLLEQEPKTGYWIEVIDEIDSLGNKTWHHKCSICGNEKSGWGNYKYCPNCGAKMKVDE